MAGQLEGKVALVTGASSGIGQVTALAFSREGAKVVIAARRIPESEGTVKMIEEAGGEAIFVKTDVSKRAEVEALVDRTVEHFGGLDCAFNNAGIPQIPRCPAVECTEESWDQVIDTNLKGMWLCMKYEIPQMLIRGGGAIVNCSSGVGLIGNSNSPAYISSKHGIVGLTRSAALDYAKKGIRVNAVCPGATRTLQLERYIREVGEAQVALQTPMGRIGEPEEIADAVIWLCSDTSSFVTGQALAVDGGWTAGTPEVE